MTATGDGAWDGGQTQPGDLTGSVADVFLDAETAAAEETRKRETAGRLGFIGEPPKAPGRHRREASA